MSDQEFRDQVLHAIEELKRSNERSIEEVKHSIEEVKRSNERSIEEVKHSIEEVKRDVKSIDTGLRDVEQDVAWIKGKLEGTQQAVSNTDAKSALWIALGSAVAAIISLIKSFW